MGRQTQPQLPSHKRTHRQRTLPPRRSTGLRATHSLCRFSGNLHSCRSRVPEPRALKSIDLFAGVNYIAARTAGDASGVPGAGATFPEWAVFGSTGILPWDAASIWWWIIIQGVVDSTGMIHRQITANLLRALEDTPAVLVNGARQTMKSGPQYLTFDDPGVLAAARAISVC